MFRLHKGLFLALAIFAQLYSTLYAVPLAQLNYADYVDDDDDDTDVIEIDLNAIDMEMDPARDLIDLSFYGTALYGQPDGEATAQLVANYTAAESDVNPEELGSYLEGDILMPTPVGGELTKNGITSQTSRWPRGIVPFEIRGQFGARDLATIQQAMEQYHQRTCIRFVPRTSERDYISIVSGSSGCWSSVGRVGGKQEVNLQSPGCLTKTGTPIHELMHALGFLHEQNRHERDSFVSIQLQNVQPKAVTNFEKAARTVAFGVPYDYGSVMHYSANAFSQNGRPTIVAMQANGNTRMGQRDGFSAYDVEKINKMYNCGAQGSPQAPAPLPLPAPAPANNGNFMGNFFGGLLSGLGLAEEEKMQTTEMNEV